MCSTRSHGVGQGGGFRPLSLEDEPGQDRIARGDSAKGADGGSGPGRATPIRRWPSWSMRATVAVSKWWWTWREGLLPAPPRSLPPPSPRPEILRLLQLALVGDSVPPMDIDEFYEADPRRRPSAELELGSEWLGEGRRPARVELRGGHRRALRAPRRRQPHVAISSPRRDPRHAPSPGVREQDHRATNHRQDRHGRRPAQDPRRVAGGHAGGRRPGDALAGPAPGWPPASPGSDGYRISDS